MSQLDTEKLGLVFQSRPDILDGIREAADSPGRIDLFNNIAAFVLEQLTADAADQPVSKRRRVDVDQTNGTSNGHVKTEGTSSTDIVAEAAAEELQLEIKDVSVSIPQRKKYNLCLTKHFIFARTNADPKPVTGMVWRWEDIEHVFFLPVPEKTQQQFNYVFLPRGTYLPTSNNQSTTGGKPSQPSSSAAAEPLLFTIPLAAPKPGSLAGKVAAQAQVAADSYSSLVNWAVPQFLRAAATRLGLSSPVEIVASDPKQFASAVRQSHRPSEKAVHVKAFRGSKDGYLFFLRTGILWGFKKPLVFLPLDRIVSVSYTSVLQRTFNMVVEVDVGDGATEELEFSMLDQEDYGGINQDYVHKYNLQDRSMAEQRKAKRELAENAKKGGAGAAAGEDGEDAAADGDTNMGELQKAEMEEEQRLQDEEDEDEEDYDPGSDGDSEGEGTSSEEEDGDGDGGGDDDDADDDDDEGEDDL
ncbi:uncharacterized protein PgNI_11922 [Pyricularia grisea]|uniref:Histone chaperone RTT106/FACT complex subunit SPT16-like middle domain-containing protein n=1 Tax=Pyricularia grisea TaxID=148305 RepID=A0A6P8AQY3_PYRGI|nr:uncharacterized protein PgNI_11922 [Pyricularia grisea]TLD04472.1 hypothetical protein PgNI_11922 [Pyricularia grisea]